MENQTEHQDKRVHFKDRISKMKSELESLAKDAGKLKNKHLADIMLAGIGRLSDALDHPDVELLSDDAIREEVEKSQAQRDLEAAEVGAAGRENPAYGKVQPPGSVIFPEGDHVSHDAPAFGQTG